MIGIPRACRRASSVAVLTAVTLGNLYGRGVPEELARPLDRVVFAQDDQPLRRQRAFSSEEASTEYDDDTEASVQVPPTAFLPSCDAFALTAAHLRSVNRVKRSSGGNMGGVFFIELRDPGCTVVLKPTCDLHDVYASMLAKTLNAPVIRTRILTVNDELYITLSESFRSLGLEEALAYVKGLNSNGLVQLMGLANGKDLYDELRKTWGWRTCDKCLRLDMEKHVLDGLMAHSVNQFPEIVEHVVSNQTYDGRTTTKINLQDFRTICKEIWKYTVKKKPDRAKQFKPKLGACPLDWRTGDTFKEDFAALVSNDYEVFMNILESSFAPNEVKFKGLLCPDERKPDDKAVIEARDFLQRVILSESSLTDLAALSAFASFIHEDDNVNTVDNAMANYANVFFSGQHLTGIDMAVGGAERHELIRPGMPPENVTEEFGIDYREIRTAARLATCGTDAELAPLADKFAFRMSFPHRHFDSEKPFDACARREGRVLPMKSVRPQALKVLRMWPVAMKAYLKAGDDAIQTTTEMARYFDQPGAEAIQAWLSLHTDELRSHFTAGVADCAASSPISPGSGEPDYSQSNEGELPTSVVIVVLLALFAVACFFFSRPPEDERMGEMMGARARISTSARSSRSVQRQQEAVTELAEVGLHG
eukprot:TRINITY_DN17158_c0_g1_i2.p1 TRINITY_DN17158_c0_g1~~TRINITY_DN17158_c0_g1_i2.p1  ORF type:complete len:668 (+),score=130.31 TRINITY_DN17158_c0_g1_i2:55-2004(+)